MRLFILPMLALCLWLAPASANAESGANTAQVAGIAVIDFDYVDTSGEERDQRREHEARLEAFMRALKGDLAKGGSFRIVTPACAPGPCALAGVTVGNLVTAAREAGADILLIGGIHKMSTLVQNAKVEAIDTSTGRVMFVKLFTFRGDTDDAWRRAETFIANEIVAGGAPSPVTANANPPPIKIAVFDFELDDFSGGAGVADNHAADLVQLDRATSEARRLIAQIRDTVPYPRRPYRHARHGATKRSSHRRGLFLESRRGLADQEQPARQPLKATASRGAPGALCRPGRSPHNAARNRTAAATKPCAKA